ncbi:hypothetical protein C5167_050597 [Papaver somniferum]|uniref:ubiquitinyl hydrolase 1 n=1 Tax=Papaver somniferum TaxID=3469 RepID=A0A4Y7KTC3_PAPSO|nr:hypothetical protein C5167_050597 [Papaver somniferum]
MATPNQQQITKTSDTMFHDEILDIPPPELQDLKTLKVAFRHATKEDMVVYSINLPVQSTVGDVIYDLKTKVELSHPNAKLRLLEVFHHKIYKIFPLSEKIGNINVNDQYGKLRAEEISGEDKNLGPRDRLIHVYHFTIDASQSGMVKNFGEPFLFITHEKETLVEVKFRIQKKLQVSDEEFATWKFAFLSLGQPEYLRNSDVVSSLFQGIDIYGAWGQYLGLEHSESSWRKAYPTNQTSDILNYKGLDIPPPELQGLKTLKVAFHHATKEDMVVHSISLPIQSTVGDVINDVKTKVELSHPDAKLRLLEVFHHKIYKIFRLSEKIVNINVNDQYGKLRAEEISEEEKNLGPRDRLIPVYHFAIDASQSEMVKNFGEPFFFIIHEKETLVEVKSRIQKKLQVSDEEFAKWKFAFLSLGRPEYLRNSDVVSSLFQRIDQYGAWGQYLGLEHSESSWKRAYPTNQDVLALGKY